MGVVASMLLSVKSVSAAVESELDRVVDTFHEPCNLGPFGGIVVWARGLTRKS